MAFSSLFRCVVKNTESTDRNDFELGAVYPRIFAVVLYLSSASHNSFVCVVNIQQKMSMGQHSTKDVLRIFYI